MTTGNVIQMSSLADDIDAERVIAAQAGLVVHDAESLNCETPPALLGGGVTPTAQFYRRSHFPAPALDASAWRLDVRGLVRRPLNLSLHDMTQLPAETAVVTLGVCGQRPDAVPAAGPRRAVGVWGRGHRGMDRTAPRRRPGPGWRRARRQRGGFRRCR